MPLPVNNGHRGTRQAWLYMKGWTQFSKTHKPVEAFYRNYSNVQFSLTVMLRTGIGTNWDVELALMWLNKAAEQRHQTTFSALEEFSRNLHPRPELNFRLSKPPFVAVALLHRQRHIADDRSRLAT